jgi:hypothetical protein
MPLHDFLCPACGTERKDIYIPIADIDSHVEACDCSKLMEHDLRQRPKNTRNIGFPEFVAIHTGRITGKKEVIKDLGDIRRLEKKYEDQGMCFEAFSYDSDHGSEPELETTKGATEGQKEAFMQEFRDRNI